MLLLSAMLIFFAGLLYVTLRFFLMSEVDEALRLRASQIHGTLDVAQGHLTSVSFDMIHTQLPPVNEFVTPGLYIQVIDESGTVLLVSDNLKGQQLPVSEAILERGRSGEASMLTLPVAGSERVRIFTTPLRVQDQPLLLQIGRSLHDVDRTLDKVLHIIIPGILVAQVLAVVSALFLTRKALRPVAEIAETARRIEEGPDLEQRVAYAGPADEVGKLAETFNRMIETIQHFVESQKHFVADASHDLRTPLTVIKGNLDLLKRNISQEDRDESLRAIEAEVTQMERIVSDLLLLAQIDSHESLARSPVRLDALVEEVHAAARVVADGREVVLLRNDPVQVRGDAEKLKQLLSNLVDNAIKYTPREGTITISLRGDGDWARLEVADTGIGIAPEHLPHIFDRFYRVDKSRSRAAGGTGLGLTIAKGIAEAHGGRITVASRPQEGSTFTVWIKT